MTALALMIIVTLQTKNNNVVVGMNDSSDSDKHYEN